MKPTALLSVDQRIRRYKSYGRARKSKEHRCERRKVRELMHRWEPAEDLEG